MRQAGAVVNLSSLSAVQVNADAASYNVCKAAQDHLTKTLARKYTKRGVRVNSVNPCYVRRSAVAPPVDGHRACNVHLSGLRPS